MGLSLKNVTAVLITRRPEYPKEIKLEGFGEVIIKNNSTSVYERYLQAAKAKNETIYIQDDDCVVDYRELFKHYNGGLTNATSGRNQFYDKVSGGRITLVGWGAFFPKKLLASFDKYIERYGVDEHLLMEADRVFTWLNYPHQTIKLPHRDLEFAQSPGQMSSRPNHLRYLQETIAKLKKIAPLPSLSRTDFWRAVIVGAAIALLSLPTFRNLGILSSAVLVPWLIGLPLGAGFGLWLIHRLFRHRRRLIFDLAKYGLIGWLNVFLSLAVFNSLVWATGIAAGLWSVLFLTVAFVLTVTHSFLWNKFWVFPARGTRRTKKEYLQFFVITGTTALLEIILFHLIVNVAGAPAGLNPVWWANITLGILIPVSVLGNFAGYKLIVFK